MASTPSDTEANNERSARPGLKVFLIAGEPSGDVLGGGLMSAISELSEEPVHFRGVGGPAMQDAGLSSLFDYSELSIMGLVEIVPHIPHLLRRMRLVAEEIERERPDVLITIDSPGFIFGVIRRLRSHECPRIHYVAPSVWAWRPRRVHKFRRHFDHLLALLPFEPEYFESVGLDTTFVGHPVTEGESEPDAEAKSRFREKLEIPSQAILLCVLPGSRRGELARHFAPFGETVRVLAKIRPDLHVVIPTLPHLHALVTSGTADWPVPVAIVTDDAERNIAMAASDLALAVSGTVTLELARARVPTVVAYRLSPVTAVLVRRMIKVRYASIVNLIAGHEAIPEFLQHRGRPEVMAQALDGLITGPEKRYTMQAAQAAAMQALGEGGTSPSRRAAAVVLEVVREWRKRLR